MALITEAEFARICSGIKADSESIVKFNPIGTREDILTWMLLSCLVTYLSLTDEETPCFPGRPDSRSYREAIAFILRTRSDGDFEPGPYIDAMLKYDH